MSREENLYQRGTTWWFRANVNGHEYRESLRTSDVKVARKLRDKKLEELRHYNATGEKPVTWMEAVVAWADHTVGQLAATTRKRYAVSFKQCEPWLKDRLITEIDGKLIAEMMGARKRQGTSSATIRRDLTAVSRVLEYAEAMEWREGNPTLSKRRLHKERRDPIVLPEQDQIDEMVIACTPRFGSMVRAAALTGCRQDELVRLTWKQFKPKAGTLDVIGKGNKRRTLHLSEEALAHFSAQPRTPGGDLIFCKENGDKFEQAASDFCHFRRGLESRAKKERRVFSRFRFHDLRHFYAVMALRSGIDIYTLSQHLGHTSVKTTEIYLAFLTPAEALRAKHGGSVVGTGVGTKVGTVTAVSPE